VRFIDSRVRQRAHRYTHAAHVEGHRVPPQGVVRRDTLDSVDDVEVPEPGAEEHPRATPEGGRDRLRGPGAHPGVVRVARQADDELGDAREIRRVRVEDDVEVLALTGYAPSTRRESPDNDQVQLRCNEAVEQLGNV
jgi:hypothetical protein